MRLVDQYGKIDVPYENVIVRIHTVHKWIDKGVWRDCTEIMCSGAFAMGEWTETLGTYNDEEEAGKVIKCMMEAYKSDAKYFRFPEKRRSFRDMKIADLELSVRSFNVLMRAGLRTVEDVMKKSQKELLDIRHMGKKSLDEITEKMREVGAWK